MSLDEICHCATRGNSETSFQRLKVCDVHTIPFGPGIWLLGGSRGAEDEGEGGGNDRF